MDKQVTVNAGISFGGLICLVLIVLKLIGAIEMNWLLVLTSWFWFPVLIILAALILFAAIAAVVVGTWFVIELVKK